MAKKPKAGNPADSIEQVDLADLEPYARNSRTHSDEQIDQLVRSIKQFGFTMPVLADEAGMIIAGHGRVLAAAKAGLTAVPVMTARGWSDEQKRIYVIADNQLTLRGDWDDAMLRSEIAELQNLDADISLTGFSGDEIDKMLNGDDLVDIDPGSDASASGVQTDNLQFGKHKVPLTDQEFAKLSALLKAHVNETGSQFGFIRSLLGE